MATDAPVPFICNPVAGRGRTARRSPVIARMLAENGVKTEILESREKGGIEHLVAEAASAGHRQLIVAGGDGTIHEAVNGLMKSGTKAALGIIPTGTGNDFVKSCAIPMYFEHATALLADRVSSNTSPIGIDVGRMNGRYFINGAGIGFDARVSDLAGRIRLPIGDLVYFVGLIRALSQGIATPELSIRFGDNELTGAVTLANFANGPWVGGMFHIAPDARNDDGLLELIYAEPVSVTRLLALLPKITRGDHMQEVEVHNFPVRSAIVEAEEPVLSHLDGEIQPLNTQFAIDILPGALALL